MAVKLHHLFIYPCMLLLLAMFIHASSLTWNWPVQHDNGMLYSLGYQLLHGVAPYRDIFALDMPGTILIHAMGIGLFGPGDLGNRELYLLWQILITVSIGSFFRKGAWPYALAAGFAYAIYHMSTGVHQMLQREYLMLPFLMLAAATILRRYGFLFGAAAALACFVKPTAVIFGAFIFIIACIRLPRKEQFSLFCAASAGAMSVTLAFALWLHAIGSLQDMVDTALNYIPIYNSMGPRPSLYAGLSWMWPYMLAALAMSLPLILKGDRRAAMLLAGYIYGLIHFFMQSFDWPHRLVPMHFFLIMQFFYTAYFYSQQHIGRYISMLMLAFACYLASPLYLIKPAKLAARTDTTARAQIVDMIGRSFPKNAPRTIQVIDIVTDLNYAITELGLAPATRCIYPPIYYYKVEHAFVQKMLDNCLADMEKQPPSLIVISSDSYPFVFTSFQTLKNDRLSRLLERHYILTIDGGAYQIYRYEKHKAPPRLPDPLRSGAF